MAYFSSLCVLYFCLACPPSLDSFIQHFVTGTMLASKSIVGRRTKQEEQNGKAMEPIKVFVVEDSPGILDYLSELLKINGYQAHCLSEKRKFLIELDHYDPDLLLLGPSNHTGHIRALSEVIEREKGRTPILVITDGNASPPDEIALCKVNLAYLHVGFNNYDLKRVIEQLIQESQDFVCKELDDAIIGQTPIMAQLKQHIIRAAKSDATVLLTGESGTGKELVAREIHKASSRVENPFVKVNSAALPRNLLESELFGFEKGAFTGAFNKKPGKFELAHSGTIFLDEIGDISLSIQAKLLQVLEDNEVASLGSITNTKIDARVLAATNHDLGDMVSLGLFRADLYYRLHVVAIHIRPLRERKKDIGLLCNHFLKKYAARHSKKFFPLSPEIQEQFCEYSWPGNVRELENLIQTITVLGNNREMYKKMGDHRLNSAFSFATNPLMTDETDFDNNVNLTTPRSLKKVCRKAVQKAETQAITDVLFHTRWNRKKAAELLQVSYKGLLSKIKDYGIRENYHEFARKDNRSGDYNKEFLV